MLTATAVTVSKCLGDLSQSLELRPHGGKVKTQGKRQGFRYSQNTDSCRWGLGGQI